MRPPKVCALLAVLALADIAAAQDAAQGALSSQPPLAETIDSLPRLSGLTVAALRINAQMDKDDDKILELALACRAPPPNSWWERDMQIAFSGPGFLSLRTLNDFYCDGAAHPNWYLETPTYDLVTGQHVDWRQMLPANLLSPQLQRFDLAVVNGSPQLVELYLRSNPTSSPRCQDEIAASVTYFRLWLSAQDSGLMLIPDGLAYAVQACGDPVILSVATLREIGESAVLTNSLARGIRDAP